MLLLIKAYRDNLLNIKRLRSSKRRGVEKKIASECTRESGRVGRQMLHSARVCYKMNRFEPTSRLKFVPKPFNRRRLALVTLSRHDLERPVERRTLRALAGRQRCRGRGNREGLPSVARLRFRSRRTTTIGQSAHTTEAPIESAERLLRATPKHRSCDKLYIFSL